MAEKPLIALVDIHKQYETLGAPPVKVLHGISLEIHAGQFVCLMGQSGSGKSTLMNILGCLDSPSAGDYFLEGKSVSAMKPDELATIRNQKLGFVFQGFNLLKRMTAIDNVALPLLYAGVPRREALARAQEKLTLTGLGQYADRLPNQMSGGQQQRVAIARALTTQPAVLLADEPTGNLDTVTSAEVMALITRLNRESGITVILVTHESDIAAYGQRLIRLKDGLVIYDGPVQHEAKATA
jgi:putative ABC transport system ATP-binding protein